MYSLTFCLRFLLPERHQWKPAVQTAAVMLRTPPVGGRSPAGRPRPLPVCGARFGGRPPSPAGRRLATRADPANGRHAAGRSHYAVVSRDGRKLVTIGSRYVATATHCRCTDCKSAQWCTTRAQPLPRWPLPRLQVTSGSVQ